MMHYTSWAVRHAKVCQHGCHSEGVHYRKWREVYMPYVDELLVIVRKRFKVPDDDFIKFVYNNSKDMKYGF